MRVTVPKLFELFQLDEKLRGVGPLVDFLNTSLEQVIKALQGRLTIRDNGFAELRSLEFRKPSPATDSAGGYFPWEQTFTPAQRTVEGVLLLQTEAKNGNTVASWRWEFLSNGSIRLTVYPRDTTSNESLTAKFAVLFQ